MLNKQRVCFVSYYEAGQKMRERWWPRAARHDHSDTFLSSLHRLFLAKFVLLHPSCTFETVFWKKGTLLLVSDCGKWTKSDSSWTETVTLWRTAELVPAVLCNLRLGQFSQDRRENMNAWRKRPFYIRKILEAQREHFMPQKKNWLLKKKVFSLKKKWQLS